MFRVSFRLTDDPGHAQDWGRKLRRAVPTGVMIVADFMDAKTFEAFVDTDEDAEIHSVAKLIARRLGVNEYEVTEVEPSGAQTAEVSAREVHNGGMRLVHVHPAAITRVFVHQPDERALYVQVRHRPHERIEAIAVNESDDTVELGVTVGTLEPDASVSLGVTFTWVPVILHRPVAARHIVRRPSSRATYRSP